MDDSGQGTVDGSAFGCLNQIIGVEAGGGVRDEDDNYLFLDTRIMHRSRPSSLIVTMIRVVY